MRGGVYVLRYCYPRLIEPEFLQSLVFVVSSARETAAYMENVSGVFRGGVGLVERESGERELDLYAE